MVNRERGHRGRLLGAVTFAQPMRSVALSLQPYACVLSHVNTWGTKAWGMESAAGRGSSVGM